MNKPSQRASAVAAWSAAVVVATALTAGCAGKKGSPAQPRAAGPAPVAPSPATQPAPMAKPVARTGTLFERLGGGEAIAKVVDDFVTRALEDPAVNFTRKGQAAAWEATPQNVERLKQRLVQFIATAAGGPTHLQYRGRDLVTAHKGMGVTHAQFDALAGHLRAAMEANQMPRREREELLNMVASTRAAIVEAPETSTVAPIATVPTEAVVEEPAAPETLPDGQEPAAEPQDQTEMTAPAEVPVEAPTEAPTEFPAEDSIPAPEQTSDEPTPEDAPPQDAPAEVPEPQEPSQESAEAPEYGVEPR